MSGAAYGISGFVDGFMGGRNQRNAWEDRKLDRARQERLDGESTEEHRARMRAYDRQESDWRKSREDQQRLADAALKQYDLEHGIAPEGGAGIEPLGVTATATGAVAPQIPLPPVAGASPLPHPGQTMAAPPAAAAPQAAPAPSASLSTMSAPPIAAPQPMTGPAGGPAPIGAMPMQAGPQALPGMSGPAGGPMPMGVAGQAADAPAAQTGPDPSMGRIVAIPGSNEQILLRPDGSVYWLSTGLRETDESVINAVKEIAVPLQVLPKPAAQQGGLSQAEKDARLKAALDMDIGMIKMPDRNTNYSHNWGESLVKDGREAQNRAGAMVYNGIGAVADTVNSGINLVSGGINSAADYVAGRDVPNIPMIQPTPRMGATAPQAANPSDASGGVTSSPGVAAQPAAADAAEKQATQGAIQVTATAAPAMGVKPGEKITPAQLEKAADAGVDYYMREGQNLVVRAYLENGDLAGAQKYQEYLDQKETKDGLRSWTKARFLMGMGDFEGAGNQIIEAYNNLGYFSDGTTIVKGESGFVYGDPANPERPTGARVTFRDEDSGKTWVQDFSSPNDFLELAFTMVSPEAGFDHFAAKVAADQTAAAEAAKLGMDTRVKIADAIAAEKKILVSAINGGMPTPEQIAQAEIDAARNVYARLGMPSPADLAPTDPLGVTAEGEAPAEEPIIARRPTN